MSNYFDTSYDNELKAIPFFTNHPSFLPYVGVNYRDAKLKILHIGNCHYIEPSQDPDFEYDFYRYFRNILSFNYKPLERKHNRITVTVPEPVYDWKEYALKVMLYAKRRGDTIITRAERDVTEEY